jgi:hypothetical protein
LPATSFWEHSGLLTPGDRPVPGLGDLKPDRLDLKRRETRKRFHAFLLTREEIRRMDVRAMMTQRLRFDYSEDGMYQLFVQLDKLHDCASEGRLAEVTDLTNEEMRGWLEDIVYTARETIREMERHERRSRRRRRT